MTIFLGGCLLTINMVSLNSSRNVRNYESIFLSVPFLFDLILISMLLVDWILFVYEI